ncbi:TPA: hypothetical protein ACH3X3_013336 [Trebouxia sp. C0006]
MADEESNPGMIVFLLLLWAAIGHRITARLSFVGDGMTACGLGLAMGLALLAAHEFLGEESLHAMLTFNPGNFFTFFLPPIIFSAGLSVRKKSFFRNFVSIASLGILGTYVALTFIVLSLLLYRKCFGFLTMQDILALGAIFATTDSVAVLQVLNKDRSPILFSLVFGEGVINDAAGVALLRAIQELGDDPSLTFKTSVAITFSFLYLFVASGLLGAAFGLTAALLLKASPSIHVHQAVSMVGMIAYLSYLVAEHFGCSGIVAIFTCAVVMSHYALYNVPREMRKATRHTAEVFSYMCEGAIFLYVGLDTIDPVTWQNSNFGVAVGLAALIIFVCMLGRACFVFPLIHLHNKWRPENVKVREMVVIWWSGSMRGAVSVALVYHFFDFSDESEHVASIIAMTIIVVVFSTMVFGAVTKPLLDLMLGKELPDAHSHLPRHHADKPSPSGPQPEVEMKPYRPSRFGQEAAAISPRISARPSDLPMSEPAPEISGDNDAIVFANEEGAEVDSEHRGLLSNVSFNRPGHALSRLMPSFSKLPLYPPDGEEGSSSEVRGLSPGEGPKVPYPKPGPLGRVLAEDRSPRESRATEEEPDIEDTAMHKRMQQWWANFDDTYMQPVFGGPKFKVSR